MMAYKGFDLKLRGHGGFRFRPGKTYTEKECKTARNGFHCAEYPFVCCSYFPVGGGNRFFMVEVGGDIDEDEYERISATEMRLVKELTLREFAGHGMMYMVDHPQRKWVRDEGGVTVRAEEAEAGAGRIAIARGLHPRVRGQKGSILGLILEEDGAIIAARLFEAGKEAKPKTWYTVTKDGEVVPDDRD